MHIQCTKKLLDKMKLKPEEGSNSEEDSLMDWHAHLITMNRRQVVVLMNDATRYGIVLYGLKANDFSNLAPLIHQAIKEVWLAEGIAEDVIDTYLTEAGDIRFTKTKNRTCVARLNKTCDNVYFHEQFYSNPVKIHTLLSKRVSRMPVGDPIKKYILPHEELYARLESWTGGSIFQIKMAELHVRLDLEAHEVWRRLVVPLHYTFHEFHEVLQSAFHWQDSHLHEFYIHEKTDEYVDVHPQDPRSFRDGYTATHCFVNHEEALAYPDETLEMALEDGRKLSEFIPPTEVLVYVYDYGDHWQHEIDVIRVYDETEVNDSICLDGAGSAPPEDVGGEGGYEAFLEAFNDETHPDHAFMKRWVMTQGYEAFNLDMINMRLK